METYKTLVHAELRVGKDVAALGVAAARDFVAVANKAIRRTGHFSVCLSGGETPQSLFSALVAAHQETMDWSRVLVYWGDERAVGPDHEDSNYAMAKRHLLDKVPVPVLNIVRIKAELPAADAADLYRHDLRRLGERSGSTLPRFDLMILGMGDDGHTASLFPGTAALAEKVQTVVANHVPQLNTNRITLTYPVLNQARAVMVLVSGASKAATVRRVLDGAPDLSLLPMQGIRPVEGSLTWYLCSAAAGAPLTSPPAS